MNQFKRAKTERINSGKPVEKASDLTTAGTKESTKEAKKAAPDIELSVSKPEITKDISPIKAEIDQPVEADLDTSDTNISNPKDIISIQPEEAIQVTIPEPVASITEVTIPKEQPVQLESPSNSAPVVQEFNVEEQTTEIPMQEATYTAAVTSVPLQVANIQPPVMQPQAMTHTSITPPLTEQMVATPMPVTQSQGITMISQSFEPPVSPLLTNYGVPQEVAIVKETTVKKTAPNIFHNKGESKSVRKSLVLKPTSVKIAENYCSKNGGSFNELVQHLLDNFIDEYGLR